MTMLWYPIEIERALSAGYRYREQLRREAQEREARAGRPAPVRGAAPLASRMMALEESWGNATPEPAPLDR